MPTQRGKERKGCHLPMNKLLVLKYKGRSDDKTEGHKISTDIEEQLLCLYIIVIKMFDN
jgi:hypothetical protein